MRIIKEDSCNADEQQVEFTATVMGTKIKACVSTKKQAFVVKNQTYVYGGHCVIQPYPKSPTSELEIFNEYNFFGKEKGETTFIEHPDEKGNMMVGFGTGGLLGGLDKELTFKRVDERTFNKIVTLEKERERLEEIKNKNNYLFGGSDRETISMIHGLQYELDEKLRLLTGWTC
ncbi:MAG: hypothetical protein NTW30_05855 [Candidatus Aenigmarchaeota archaeon]|nr:hypothetical protein [Candidatus Aenigmarchaeota archaeon]